MFKIAICGIKSSRLKTFNIYKNLGWLNELPDDQAVSVFTSISGSELWARRMTKLRPFAMLEHIFAAADNTWSAMPASELVSVFSGLSEPKARVASFTSAGAVHLANGPDLSVPQSDDDLAQAESLYLAKFGFIFVLHSSGKSSQEVLAICRARLGNSVETELRIAAEEQRKIIEIRLNNILEQ